MMSVVQPNPQEQIIPPALRPLLADEASREQFLALIRHAAKTELGRLVHEVLRIILRRNACDLGLSTVGE